MGAKSFYLVVQALVVYIQLGFELQAVIDFIDEMSDPFNFEIAVEKRIQLRLRGGVGDITLPG